jgi:hypothetical protein
MALTVEAVWRLGQARAKGDGRLRELNRMGEDIGWGSGHLESIECPRRGSGRCPGGQAEMWEDRDSIAIFPSLVQK